MWTIFDELIAEVPLNLHVEGCVIGLHWTLIRSTAIGMALTPFTRNQAYGPKGTSVTVGIGERIAGMPVHKLAEFFKSWNPFEATLGLAAINSALNSPEVVVIVWRTRLRSALSNIMQKHCVARKWR
jgi:uncharacterized protein (DUF4213/DUF364 family)